MNTPPSRVYSCFLEDPESPDSAACQAAVALGGTQPLYDWNEINIGDANGRHRELIPDGKLCSAGRDKYKGFDLARNDWPATNIAPDANGNFQFVYNATAPHGTRYFEFYVTKNGYNPTQPLKWSDLEATPFCTITNVTLQNGQYHMTCPLPQGKSGRHVIYNIWQRSDSPEAFYACSDVIFNGTAVTPTPSATAVPVTVTPTPTTPAGCNVPPWQTHIVYTGGNQVSHGGKKWQARWWTQGEEPGTTGQWGVWQDVGPCGGQTVTPPPPTQTNTPIPTATNIPSLTPSVVPSNTPTRTPSPTPTTPGNSCAGVPQYTAGTTYSTGQFVQNVGNKYQCTVGGWCSSAGAWAYEPGVGLYWQTAWNYVSACNSEPTPTPTIPAPPFTHTPTPSPTVDPSPTPCPNCTSSNRLLVGYWHNFDNGSGYIRLRNVSPAFDVINVSFAEPTGAAGNIGFVPYGATQAEFISDINYLKSQGKKVIISIGGANGQVQLVDPAARQNFVTSMTNIIQTYGFNGLDIDFEGHSLYLNPGDVDINNPTTPVITNLITAIRQLKQTFGSSFMLTMAPETFFVQVGYTHYGGLGVSDNRAGAYLPVIHNLRDLLGWLQVQHYNSGPIRALDGQYYNMGNADFHVAMAEMVLQGFPVAGNQNNFFPGLRPDQVLIGLPANINAGNGYTSELEVQRALNYLIRGQAFGGSYVLRNPAGYPGLRGLMTWSVNWDAFNNFAFSTSHRTYLNNLPQ
jgi:chitinase